MELELHIKAHKINEPTSNRPCSPQNIREESQINKAQGVIYNIDISIRCSKVRFSSIMLAPWLELKLVYYLTQARVKAKLSSLEM